MVRRPPWLERTDGGRALSDWRRVAMRRRDVLAGAGAATAGVAAGFPRPTVAQVRRELKMVTDWPEGSPGLQGSAVRLAETVGVASGGRIRIEVFPAGTFVRAFETFDAVGAGVADIFHSSPAYLDKKSPASNFFANTIPFGMTADELFSWVHFGGGQELWDELYGRFDVKPLLCTSTGSQMGGWFNKEITSPESFKGLRYRMAGLGGEVLRRLGATVVLLPGGEIVPALKSGALDASEWVGPWLDVFSGLNTAVGYYYYPGFHEPGTGLFLGVNRRVWEGLDANDRRLIETVAAGEFARSLAEFNANNAIWLRKLRDEGKVKILRFDDTLLRAFREISADVVAEFADGDEVTRRIYASYQRFRALSADWSDVAERAFMNARRLA
jgi:TRAP-type mannitol/chloroaromatic compound transport system substrate-binding protein